MSGITDLSTLLRQITPVLQPGTWVFSTTRDRALVGRLRALCTFEENEGVTAICERDSAVAAGLPFQGEYRQITLSVHSSLEAVGFLAAVSAALAKAGIPCNAVSAYHHDHLFVPAARAQEAMATLQALT